MTYTELYRLAARIEWRMCEAIERRERARYDRLGRLLRRVRCAMAG